MADPLVTILRLRRLTVDDAKRHLAERLTAEQQAGQAYQAAQAAIAFECKVASDIEATDRAVEAYAAWLPLGRARADAAREALEQARSEVAKARAALTASRAAAEVAGAVLDRRLETLAEQAGRRAQAETDEIAARVKGPANP